MAYISRILIVPLLLVALSGCKLIDQTTFDPDADTGPSASELAAAAQIRPAGQLALVTIRFDTAAPAFQDQLGFAVHAAEQRRPGGQYDVTGVSTAADAAQTSRDSVTVMEAMLGLGIPADRIHLGAHIDPAQAVREVRVYLR